MKAWFSTQSHNKTAVSVQCWTRSQECVRLRVTITVQSRKFLILELESVPQEMRIPHRWLDVSVDCVSVYI